VPVAAVVVVAAVAAAAAEPYDTARRALWIGGGQWAGTTTVSRIVAYRHGLTAYHHDYHDARAHNDRWIAVEGSRAAPDWMNATPEELAAAVLAGFPRRFEWILDDLRALVSPRPILAEGWGLRPELVLPLAGDPGRMIVMVPTEDFRRHQVQTLDRAARVGAEVSDPELAQQRRLIRDRLVALDAVESAERLGVRVLEVDGSTDAGGVADILTGHFRRYL
jgi:hypothetical protein